ncbi:hypothetical protein M514_12805 [Trichuris suis]|uniref:Uncharacterized protein n=1 Tax=Trichuris suis TaxID=68888 RepID=A0A085N3F8_9BILA|nr:hypothetical protein M513_12805 [Trichuris suis]KFD64004.1 hypothetical protein M514_12805 [Trichuris suis]
MNKTLKTLKGSAPKIGSSQLNNKTQMPVVRNACASVQFRLVRNRTKASQLWIKHVKIPLTTTPRSQLIVLLCLIKNASDVPYGKVYGTIQYYYVSFVGSCDDHVFI